jgi:fermentation-respiration switch protein FrsA (DUF1100 family)
MWVKLVTVAAVVLVALAGLIRAVEARFAFFPIPGDTASPDALGVAFERHTLTTADGEHLRAWLLPSVNPRALVLYFHGNGGNLSVWLPILAGLQQRGYAVAAFDYRGYGASTGRPSERGLYRDADTAIAWAAQWVRPGIPLVYWGRSLGTAVAAYAATRAHPDGVILEAGFPDARSLLRASPLLALLSRFSSYRFPTAEFARRAACPVLVLHGARDLVVPVEHGRALYDALPQPKWLVVVEGGDHNDIAPADPQAYWDAVRDFIDSETSARALRHD